MKDERDFAAQVDAIENFVTQKYNIIVVAPADSKAMVTPIAKAVKAGGQGDQHRRRTRQGRQEGGGDRSRVFRSRQSRRREAGRRRARARRSGRAARWSFSKAIPEADNAVQRKKGFMDSVSGGQAAATRQQDRALGDRGSQHADDELPHPISRHPGRDGGQRLDGARRGQGARRGGLERQRSRSSASTTSRRCSRWSRAARCWRPSSNTARDMAALGINYGMREMAGEKFTGWVKTPIKLIVAKDLA